MVSDYNSDGNLNIALCRQDSLSQENPMLAYEQQKKPLNVSLHVAILYAMKSLWLTELI